MGLLSMLFGGGKSKQSKSAAKAAGPGADVIRIATPPKRDAGGSAATSAPQPAVAETRSRHKAAGLTGFDQARLRMRLVAARRAGDFETACEAARGLEAIQRQAGRRAPARVWRQEAERLEAIL